MIYVLNAHNKRSLSKLIGWHLRALRFPITVSHSGVSNLLWRGEGRAPPRGSTCRELVRGSPLRVADPLRFPSPSRSSALFRQWSSTFLARGVTASARWRLKVAPQGQSTQP